MTGRPTKLTADTAAVILAGVRDGLPQKTAAALAGVSESCLCSWIKRGRKGEEHFEEFVRSLM
jgi:transposase